MHSLRGKPDRKKATTCAGQALQPVSNAGPPCGYRWWKPLFRWALRRTKYKAGGFYMLEARDLERGAATGRHIPPARLGSVEVRPVAGVPPEKIRTFDFKLGWLLPMARPASSSSIRLNDHLKTAIRIIAVCHQTAWGVFNIQRGLP